MNLAHRWHRIHSKTIGAFRIFTIREDCHQLPRNHREAPFYILESNDWVNVSRDRRWKSFINQAIPIRY